MAMLYHLLQTRDRCVISGFGIIGKFLLMCSSIWTPSWCDKIYQLRVLNKRAKYPSVCSTLLKVTDIQVEDQQIDGLLDNHSLLRMDWTHYFVPLKLFVLHMESAKVSIFFHLLPVQSVTNKSRDPDTLLMQHQGDVFCAWGLLFCFVFSLVKYFVST